MTKKDAPAKEKGKKQAKEEAKAKPPEREEKAKEEASSVTAGASVPPKEEETPSEEVRADEKGEETEEITEEDIAEEAGGMVAGEEKPAAPVEEKGAAAAEPSPEGKDVPEEAAEKAPEEAPGAGAGSEGTEGQEGEGEAAQKPVEEERMTDWIPKTRLGNDVLAGKFKSLDDILEKGELILEPEIVDYLVPELMHEVIYIGGSPGKGGGIRRTATKMTARMHKSGRRFKLSAVSVIGNGNGIVGIGSAISKEHRTAMEKAEKQAKLNVIRVRRGCGSWECGCGGNHSIPFKVNGRSGSVHVTLIPAPKGVGMVASEETKKILKLAGISDVWVKTSGKTSTRNNLVLAVFDALKNLNMGKGDL